MTDDERKTMITIGKALTEHIKVCELVQQHTHSLAKSIQTPFDIPRPSTVSVVEHENFSDRFKMEVGFAQGALWTEQERKDHSVRLLTKMEDLFREFGVVTLFGNYDRYGFSKPVSTQG